MGKSYITVRPPLPRGVKLDENVYVPMRDGINIAVDVFSPEAEGRYPQSCQCHHTLRRYNISHPNYVTTLKGGH